MKDFVYLDTDSISSISAQLFEGNILEIIDEKAKQTGDNITDNYGSDDKKSNSVKLGISSTNVNGLNESTTREGKSIEFLNNETFKLGVKKAYDDFLYNKVYDELKQTGDIHQIKDSNQFDFVEIDDNYSVLDIYTSSKIFDTDLLRQMPYVDNRFELPSIKSLEDKFKSASKYLENPGSNKKPRHFQNIHELERFYEHFSNMSLLKTFNEMSKHLATVLGDKIILNKGNSILIGERENLRIPGETLSLANEVQLKGFGRKISRTAALHTVTDFQHSEFDKEEFLSKGTQGMLMIFLSSILNLKENDTFEIIQPIGLEFSKVPR
ncbi:MULTISPECIES: hypothetical protein [Mammaliicoccus]|uniref:DUF6414 family protein n=1 Tax=Mammaliicoccus TaxID=2803850 RepID=UPI00065C0FC8|nr:MULTISPECIES: hypothetical protein [Mammaliicoccus]AQN32234.1 hypothetical protein [Staphylococcus phage phi879]MCD5140411.1 hypothetical protein [Mammaliicoccus sciuri]PNY96151.1 hypothetical protein CD035_04050 [Mammaliicoccus sciuri]SQE50925.1 Uncharacterised protein [Mammaliicoccus sciuri]